MIDDVAIRMQGIAKGFGPASRRTLALRGIDLEVRTGELLMLSGPSGCGKTTLISIMAGIMDPDAGTCHAFGCDVATRGESWRSDFRRHRVGFVFQSFHLLPCLSVVENVAVPLLLLGVASQEAHEMAAETLEQVGLRAQLDDAPLTLSGGQQQRVAIARAIVHRPMLVICDEPTSALDQENGRRVLGLLRELAVADGRSVVVVTHDPRILPFADRIAHMDDGLIRDVSHGEADAADAADGPLSHPDAGRRRRVGPTSSLRERPGDEDPRSALADEDAGVVVILDDHEDSESDRPMDVYDYGDRHEASPRAGQLSHPSMPHPRAHP